MTIGSLSSNFKYLVSLIREYKNWWQICIQTINGKGTDVVILRNGLRIEAAKDSHLLVIMNEIFRMEVYNPSGFTIETNDIVVDIGANVGVFTMFAAQRTRNKVYSFEPFQGNIEFLNRNVSNNDLSNVFVHSVAVSAENGYTKLFLAEIPGGHLLFDHNIKGKLEKYVNVPTITLQYIIDKNNLPKIDFLKMDCEGAEGSILMSTPKDYLRRINKIAMEFHDNVSELKHEEIRKLLEEVGFTTELSWDGQSPLGYLYAKMN